MSDSGRPSIFCISTYEKGQEFMRTCAASGCEVRLLTVDKLRDADWPKDILTEFLTMPEGMTPEQVLNMVSWLMRDRRIDRIVPLDEFDLEVAALLREHARLPGMGETLTRHFRDKLAMRQVARDAGINVPEFTRVLNHDELRTFMQEVPGPWLLKPRTNASAIGIKPIAEPAELWPVLDQLGDLQSHYVLERFVAGDVFHAEGITWGGELVFSQPFAYSKPPMETMHQGGIFSTRTLDVRSADACGIAAMHEPLLRALGLQAGVTHTEFIRAHADGRFYFLETAARVGGAYIAETLEFATGVNPWREWARIEVALARGEEYRLPTIRREYAGSVISLARQEEPDTSAYADAEIEMRLHKSHHAGLIVHSEQETRVKELVTEYIDRFLVDFCAVLAAPDKPTA